MARGSRKPISGGRIVFVIGGTRSGKSQFALKLGAGMGPRKVFIATGQGLDPEMVRRIREHKARRPKTWVTYEEPIGLCHVLEKVDGPYDVIVVDCLTLWLSNLIYLELGDDEILARVKELVNTLKGLSTPIILTSNEVGLGGIPANPMARRFGDLAGSLHQEVAHQAHEVFFLTSGIPTKLK